MILHAKYENGKVTVTDKNAPDGKADAIVRLVPRAGAGDGLLSLAGIWADRTVMENLLDRITMEPGKRSDKPCVRGLRISVSDVLGWLVQGMTHDEIIQEHPDLVDKGILACLACSLGNKQTFLYQAGNGIWII